MKSIKTILIVFVIALVSTSLEAQTVNYNQLGMKAKEVGTRHPNEYIASNGKHFKIGDKIVFAKSSRDTIFTNIYKAENAVDACFKKPTPYAAANDKGLTCTITQISLTGIGGKFLGIKNTMDVALLLKSNESKDKYVILNLETAIKANEIASDKNKEQFITNRITSIKQTKDSKEADKKLKDNLDEEELIHSLEIAKRKLDLGLISHEDYDKLKAEVKSRLNKSTK